MQARFAKIIVAQNTLAYINTAHISVPEVSSGDLAGSKRFGSCELGSYGLAQVRIRITSTLLCIPILYF